MKLAIAILFLSVGAHADPVSTYGGTVGSTVGGTNLTITGNGTIGGTLDVSGAVTGASFAGAGTGLTGTAASLTAGAATTNANLTGPVTSVGNATTIVGPVPTGAVDLSTVTTALALKAPLASPTFSGTVTAAGAGGVSVTYGVTAGTFTGNGAALTSLAAAQLTGAVPTASVDLSTVTTALALKAPLASPTFSGTVTIPTLAGPTTATSSVTVNAAFSVQSGTFVVTAGAYSAPSQPCGRWYAANGAINNTTSGAATQMFFDTTVFAQGGLALVASSSGTFTIPSGQGGRYVVHAGVDFASSSLGSRYIYIAINSVQFATVVNSMAAGGVAVLNVSDIVSLSAGDTVQAMIQQASTGALATENGRASFLAICKLN